MRLSICIIYLYEILDSKRKDCLIAPIPACTHPLLSVIRSFNEILSSYGGERYEKRGMQQRVRKRFSQLQSMDEKDGRIPWYVINAAQSVEDVQKEINEIVEKTVEKVQTEELPIGTLWN